MHAFSLFVGLILISSSYSALAFPTDAVRKCLNKAERIEKVSVDTTNKAYPLPQVIKLRRFSGHFAGLMNNSGRWTCRGGLDLVGMDGDLVTAVATGKVLKVGYWHKGSNVVVMKHKDGLIVRYGFLGNTLLPRVGEEIEVGQPVGRLIAIGRRPNNRLEKFARLRLEYYKAGTQTFSRPAQTGRFNRNTDGLLDATPLLQALELQSFEAINMLRRQ